MPLLATDFVEIDIAELSAVGYHFNLRQKGNQAFAISIYEIDLLIDHKEAEQNEDQETMDLICMKLPAAYQEYIDVFSKSESNQLAPHRLYNHKITLEKDTPLGYSPLYNQTVKELRATKKYLEEHLGKGFVEPSQAPYTSPILFVKKPGGGLRFCVDYYKLNAMTRKDRYPIPLIDETLIRLSQAKVFTKLDICQAFYRIRINPESEDLTTFYTRYRAYKYKVLPFGLTNSPAIY